MWPSYTIEKMGKFWRVYWLNGAGYTLDVYFDSPEKAEWYVNARERIDAQEATRGALGDD